MLAKSSTGQSLFRRAFFQFHRQFHNVQRVQSQFRQPSFLFQEKQYLIQFRRTGEKPCGRSAGDEPQGAATPRARGFIESRAPKFDDLAAKRTAIPTRGCHSNPLRLRLLREFDLHDIFNFHRIHFAFGTHDKRNSRVPQQFAIHGKGVIGKVFQATIESAPLPEHRIVLQ